MCNMSLQMKQNSQQSSGQSYPLLDSRLGSVGGSGSKCALEGERCGCGSHSPECIQCCDDMVCENIGWPVGKRKCVVQEK